jgi:hypothetical protein
MRRLVRAIRPAQNPAVFARRIRDRKGWLQRSVPCGPFCSLSAGARRLRSWWPDVQGEQW